MRQVKPRFRLGSAELIIMSPLPMAGEPDVIYHRAPKVVLTGVGKGTMMDLVASWQ
jgi:hypothetical protein